MIRVSHIPCLPNTFFIRRMVSAVLTPLDTRQISTWREYHKQLIVTFMDEEVCCNFSPWSILKRCTLHGLDLFYPKLQEHVAVLQHLLDVT